MTTIAPKSLLGIAGALAAIAVLFVVAPYVVLVAGVAVGTIYARRWSAGDPSRSRRVVASLAVAAGVFVLVSIAWLIGVLASAYECEYDDVHCSSSAEFLAVNIAWGFLPIAALSLATGWLVTMRRTR